MQAPNYLRESNSNFTDHYQKIRPGSTMTAGDAHACFYGPQKFILVTDHFVRSLAPDGTPTQKAWTKVMTNHDPSQVDQRAIVFYGSLATQRADAAFLQRQRTRLEEFDLNSRQSQNGTRWGRVVPEVFQLMSREENKRTWLNKPKSLQKLSSNNAADVGVGASAGTPVSLASSTDDKIIAFCGREPYSFVEPAFIRYIDTDGDCTEVNPWQLRHHYNEVPFLHNDIIRSLIPVGDTEIQALTKTRNHLLALNRHKSASKSWVEATAQDIDKMMESQLCNARFFGGLDGKYVGFKPSNLNCSPCNSRTTCFSS